MSDKQGALPARDVVIRVLRWKENNKRRGELITREVQGVITPRELDELLVLQRLADLMTDLTDPFEDISEMGILDKLTKGESDERQKATIRKIPVSNGRSRLQRTGRNRHE